MGCGDIVFLRKHSFQLKNFLVVNNMKKKKKNPRGVAVAVAHISFATEASIWLNEVKSFANPYICNPSIQRTTKSPFHRLELERI